MVILCIFSLSRVNQIRVEQYVIGMEKKFIFLLFVEQSGESKNLNLPHACLRLMQSNLGQCSCSCTVYVNGHKNESAPI
jgi:hypothetical protein